MKNKSFAILNILLLGTLASCGDTKFAGDHEKRNPNPIVDKPECKDQGKGSIGTYISFIIDNSASNGSDRLATDCPGMQSGNGGNYCSQPTMRETATLAGVKYLADLSNKEPNNALAESFLSLVSYPSSGGRNVMLSGLSSKNSAVASFERYLEFTRHPSGDTPLYEGLSGGVNSLNQIARNDERSRVLIIVTDGFNNDRRLNPIYEMAKQFRDAGGLIYAITNTDGQNRNERVAKYTETINNRDNWSQDYSKAEYIARVTGGNGHEPLLKEISTEYFEIENASEMPAVMQKIVVNGAVQCK